MKDLPKWVLCDVDVLRCTRCGKTSALPNPMPLDKFLSRARRFSTTHGRCQPEFDQHVEEVVVGLEARLVDWWAGLGLYPGPLPDKLDKDIRRWLLEQLQELNDNERC